MGPFPPSLLVVLSSLLFAGSSAFPSLRLLFQDGGPGGHTKARGLHAEPAPVATGRWEWKTGEEASHKALPFPRRKREKVFPTAKSLKTTTFLQDETHPSFVGSTTELLWEDETIEPRLARKRFSAGATTTTTASSLHDPSTKAAADHLSSERYKALLDGQTTTESLSEDFTETQGPSRVRDTTQPTSTAPSPALVATSASTGATKSGGKRLGSTRSSLSPSLASSRPASTSTVPARSPSGKAPPGPDKVLGQCLLAISLLALVAGIFIITTFLLIALLLRQKRAYKLRQHNHTEMVCISSLLAAEEAEAAREKAPRAKRVKMLAENGSETDMDNLTLNSFLPDH